MDEEVRINDNGPPMCQSAQTSLNNIEFGALNNNLNDPLNEISLEMTKSVNNSLTDLMDEATTEMTKSMLNGDSDPVALNDIQSPLLRDDATCKSAVPKLMIRTTKVTAPRFKNKKDHKASNESPEKDVTSVEIDHAGAIPSKDEALHSSLKDGLPMDTCSPSSQSEAQALSDKTNTIDSSQKNVCKKACHTYQRILSDPDSEGTNPEHARRKLRRIKRKDLENIIIEQFSTQILYENELGYQKSLCQRLEGTLEAANKRALKLSMEVEDLKKITSKLEKEHSLRKQSFILPSQIKRSVGIQCHLINTCASCLTPDSDLDPVQSPSRNPKKRKREDEVIFCLSEPPNYTNSPPKELQDRIPNEWMSLYDEKLLNSNDPSGYKASSILKNNGVSDVESNLKKNSKKLQVKFRDDQIPLNPKNSARRPSQNARPLQPILKVKRKHKSIILSWDMTQGQNADRLFTFQLFACETDTFHSMQRTWHSIGEVKALELPMMCTLADFKSNCFYHFSIRGTDLKGRRGPFSKPCTIYMP